MKYQDMTEEQAEQLRRYRQNYFKRYYEEHRESMKARSAKYKKEHPEKYKYNYEKRKEYQTDYYQKNKERISEQRKRTAKNRVIVVRCRDCKHYHARPGCCDLLQKPIGKNNEWFCADGERKDD